MPAAHSAAACSPPVVLGRPAKFWRELILPSTNWGPSRSSGPGRARVDPTRMEVDGGPAQPEAPPPEAPRSNLSQARPHTVRPTAVTRHELSLEVEFNHRHVFRLPYEVIRDSCPTNFDKRRGERVFSISSGRSGAAVPRCCTRAGLCADTGRAPIPVGDGLRAEEAGIVWSKDGFKIAVVWDCGSETELDAEWVFDKVTGVPPMARYGAARCSARGSPCGRLLSGLAALQPFANAASARPRPCATLRSSTCRLQGPCNLQLRGRERQTLDTNRGSGEAGAAPVRVVVREPGRRLCRLLPR